MIIIGGLGQRKQSKKIIDDFKGRLGKKLLLNLTN